MLRGVPVAQIVDRGRRAALWDAPANVSLPPRPYGVPALPQITTNDPSAAVLSEISGATISEDSLKRLRLALLLVLPLCGGFVLPVAIGLISEKREHGIGRRARRRGSRPVSIGSSLSVQGA